MSIYESSCEPRHAPKALYGSIGNGVDILYRSIGIELTLLVCTELDVKK